MFDCIDRLAGRSDTPVRREGGSISGGVVNKWGGLGMMIFSLRFLKISCFETCTLLLELGLRPDNCQRNESATPRTTGNLQ